MSRHERGEKDHAVVTGPIPKMRAKMITITCELTAVGGDVFVIIVGEGKGAERVPAWRARVSLYPDEADANSTPMEALEGLCMALRESIRAWEAVEY